jgi:hypothetical protein
MIYTEGCFTTITLITHSENGNYMVSGLRKLYKEKHYKQVALESGFI